MLSSHILVGLIHPLSYEVKRTISKKMMCAKCNEAYYEPDITAEIDMGISYSVKGQRDGFIRETFDGLKKQLEVLLLERYTSAPY